MIIRLLEDLLTLSLWFDGLTMSATPALSLSKDSLTMSGLRPLE